MRGSSPERGSRIDRERTSIVIGRAMFHDDEPSGSQARSRVLLVQVRLSAHSMRSADRDRFAARRARRSSEITAGGRSATHTGATKRLRALALEAGQIVRAMDARNRYRFKQDEQVLGAWVNASTVFGRATGLGPAEPPGPAPAPVGEEGRTPEAGGDVRPAA